MVVWYNHKKKKTQNQNKNLNDWTETRTSPQTNSQPMRGEEMMSWIIVIIIIITTTMMTIIIMMNASGAEEQQEGGVLQQRVVSARLDSKRGCGESAAWPWLDLFLVFSCVPRSRFGRRAADRRAGTELLLPVGGGSFSSCQPWTFLGTTSARERLEATLASQKFWTGRNRVRLRVSLFFFY